LRGRANQLGIGEEAESERSWGVGSGGGKNRKCILGKAHKRVRTLKLGPVQGSWGGIRFGGPGPQRSQGELWQSTAKKGVKEHPTQTLLERGLAGGQQNVGSGGLNTSWKNRRIRGENERR